MLSKPLGRIIAGLVVVIVVMVAWFALQYDPIFSGKGREVVITVSPNESLSSVVNAMHAQGVIASTIAFQIDTTIFGSFHVDQGLYQIKQGSSFSHVRSIFSGPPNVVPVDVLAGQTLREVAVNLVADGESASFGDKFLAIAKSTHSVSLFHTVGSLEGLIGTGEYDVKPGESPSTLVTAMEKRFVTQAASVGLTPSTTYQGLNAYQLVIAASIVEKEGYYPVNMPQVARVIYNRLARGGPLQMDATVLYYLGKDGGTVTPAMLQTQEPYNTYLNTGLTPTPICAISTIAMRATLHPPAGSWLYFTLINEDGQMAFSTTFAQQLKEEKLAESRGIG
ncbi:MAG TPA: endolytic transglycosylase MltG [Acidimicrobiales bacterium]